MSLTFIFLFSLDLLKMTGTYQVSIKAMPSCLYGQEYIELLTILFSVTYFLVHFFHSVHWLAWLTRTFCCVKFGEFKSMINESE